HRIVWERLADLCQRMIETKIMCDDSGEPARLACWFWRPAKTNFQNIVVLLCVNHVLPDGSHKPVADLLPMKDLPGIKCHHEVEIRRGKLCEIHEQTFNAQRSTSNAQYLCKPVSMDSTGSPTRLRLSKRRHG